MARIRVLECASESSIRDSGSGPEPEPEHPQSPQSSRAASPTTRPVRWLTSMGVVYRPPPGDRTETEREVRGYNPPDECLRFTPSECGSRSAGRCLSAGRPGPQQGTP